MESSTENQSISTSSSGDKSVPSAATRSCSSMWATPMVCFHLSTLKALLWASTKAVYNPRITTISIFLLSLILLGVGVATNFNVEVNEHVVWTPRNSRLAEHSSWQKSSPFETERYSNLRLTFHSDGKNVLGMDQTRQVMSFVDEIFNMADVQGICSRDNFSVLGIPLFWNNSLSVFGDKVFNEDDLIDQMSAKIFPNGDPVIDPSLYGTSMRNSSTETLTSVLSYMITIRLPATQKGQQSIINLREVCLGLREKMNSEPLKVEVASSSSYRDEATRAILRDIPLVPAVFLVVCLFTTYVLSNRNKFWSRFLLGISTVVCILFSIMSGYGFMFMCGVPFTNMTQILPFVLFGVGLDDAFILYGSFSRTDPTKQPETRVLEAIEDVGTSIVLTTLTSSLAFGLGCTSSIPAVHWLCLYAFPTTILVFLYQMTYFAACLVLDEKRVAGNGCGSRTSVSVTANVHRNDSKIYASDRAGPEKAEGYDQTNNACSEASMANKEEAWSDRWMEMLAVQLVRPPLRIAVVVGFVSLFIACALSASKLKRGFSFTDILPSDSYLTDYNEKTNLYLGRSPVVPYAYFRNVDQSDVDIRRQMKNYVNELYAIDSISTSQSFFWLEDFDSFVELAKLEDLPFRKQISLFLSVGIYRKLYKSHIKLDDNGDIITSRALLYMDNVDVENVDSQVKALLDQRKVSACQPINQGQGPWAFFLYVDWFHSFEFHAVSLQEVSYAAGLGILSVTVLTFLFVPHWTAAPIILPVITILYVDLLGVMQWAGLQINAVSYISLTLSIGLMVDFILHVLFRYYEAPGNRSEKVVFALKTMGSSVLVGGLSTFLGILPLAFSTSSVFYTIFIGFLGLVTLGCGHGLVLLPVLLSLFGPEGLVLSPKRVGSPSCGDVTNNASSQFDDATSEDDSTQDSRQVDLEFSENGDVELSVEI